MKKLLLFGICAVSSIGLSACGSSAIKTVGQESYVRTFDQVTDKAPTDLAQCIEINLKAYQASAYMRPETIDIWSGAVPSADGNQPQATIEVAMPTHGRGAIHAHLKVFQRQPAVEKINDAIRKCL